MSATVEKANRIIKHVWSEPKSLAAIQGGLGFDADWWEPRYDQPWRRQYARDREEFGGAHVAAPSAPVEGPNNPDRLARELEWAEREHREATAEITDATDRQIEAALRITDLKERLA